MLLLLAIMLTANAASAADADPPPPPSQLAGQLLGPVGALALALLALFVIWRAFSTGALRTGKQVEELTHDHEVQLAELRRERDWWRNLAMESLGVGERLGGRLTARQWKGPDDA